MLSDIILVFFTASEIPMKDEKRRKEKKDENTNQQKAISAKDVF